MGDDECIGSVATSCSSQIIGDKLSGCNSLEVISYIDGNGGLCTSEILSIEAEHANNALIKGGQTLDNPLKVFDGLDPYIRWTLICILIAFVVLIFVSLYICGIYKGKQEEDEEDVIASAIAMRKANANYIEDEIEEIDQSLTHDLDVDHLCFDHDISDHINIYNVKC